MIAALHDDDPIDLVVAPAGEPLGLPRLARNSVRARLLRQGSAPLWTFGPETTRERLRRPIRAVACAIDVGRQGRSHLRLAGTYAAALGATLQVVVLMPDPDEGSLLRLAYARPFDRRALIAEVQRVAGGTLEPEVYFSTRRRLSATLTGVCDADVLFVDGPRWINRRWLTQRLSSALDYLPCQVVCVDAERQTLQWHLRPADRPQARRWPAVAVSPARRSAPAVVGAPA